MAAITETTTENVPMAVITETTMESVPMAVLAEITMESVPTIVSEEEMKAEESRAASLMHRSWSL